MRVAIVGTGPSGCYALRHLLDSPAIDSISVIDRLLTPGGLVRAGVAPDHPETKKVFDGFARTLRDPRVDCYFGVEIGRDISHSDILHHHHAVVYAVGSATSRQLGIDGEDLSGSHAATEFVAWYNGHPEYARQSFDLSAERVVIVGTGNVALDIARVLTLDFDTLRRTDIADHALDALAKSSVREVVLLARRGPETVACTSPELLALTQLRGIDVVTETTDFNRSQTPADYGARINLRLLRDLSDRTLRGDKRIVFKFHTAPAAVIGAGGRVTGLRTCDTRPEETRPSGCAGEAVLDTRLLLRSIGYRGQPVAGIPFDAASGTAPNTQGRVAPGVYVTGWFKRGPSGVIGTNKYDAAETISALIEDADTLVSPPADAFATLVTERAPGAIQMNGWTHIDAHERHTGVREGRPRVKLTDSEQMFAVARAP